MAKDERSAQEFGALFAAQMMGGVLVDAPTPGSRLARIVEADRLFAAGELTMEQCEAMRASIFAEAWAEGREHNDKGE